MLLGLDLGTSSLKAVLLSPEGKLLGEGHANYPIHSPQPGFAEQDPGDWWEATRMATTQALEGRSGKEVSAIGFSGQMHGVVLCTQSGKPLRPAVIWADTRTADLIPEFAKRVPKKHWSILGSPPAAGFAALTLLWFHLHDPKALAQTHYVLQPKDWLRMRLTGEARAEPTDASGTLLFDVTQRRWDLATGQRLGLAKELFPPLIEAGQAAGSLAKKAAEFLGLRAGIPVAAGAADQAAAAVGNGILEAGETQLMLGSGGQILSVLDKPTPDITLRTHLFCHTPTNRWYRLAAILNSGLALGWATEVLGVSRRGFFQLASESSPGAKGLLFLPHLLGERTPHMNSHARGAWIGLSRQHSRAELARAALEGVCFAFKEALEALGSPPSALRLGGGGARQRLWVQVLADVLNLPLEVSKEEESSGWGAALLGGLAGGVYRGYDEVKVQAIGVRGRVEPVREDIYLQTYRQFKEAYRRLEGLGGQA